MVRLALSRLVGFCLADHSWRLLRTIFAWANKTATVQNAKRTATPLMRMASSMRDDICVEPVEGLLEEPDRDLVLRSLDAADRTRAFIAAYGLTDVDRGRLLDSAVLRCTRVWHAMRYRAEHEGGGWARMWNEGVGDVLVRSKAWLERERQSLETAIGRS